MIQFVHFGYHLYNNHSDFEILIFQEINQLGLAILR